MDQLFTVSVGLMVWTILTFLLLVSILAKFGWGPIIKALAERERRLKEERDAAERARAEAQRIQKEIEDRLAGVAAESRKILDEAKKDGEATTAKFKSDAEMESRKIREKTKAELGEEKNRLVRELRKDVADLSILAAEKLLKQSVDEGVQKKVLDGFFKDLDKQKIGS